VEREIAALRRREKLGPLRIGFRLGLAGSTVYRVLCRLGLRRIAWMDRPTGRIIRRYERANPGDLVHIDVKKLGRIPDGGGWRVHGRALRSDTTAHKRARTGMAFIHAAVDDHSRLAYAEILADERKDTCAAFWTRANAFFAERGIRVSQVMTDNAWAYKSHAFAAALSGVDHIFIQPHRPQTNGKAERFNRTLLEEWAYVRPYDSETERAVALAPWLHTYNHHRGHTSLGGKPPADRVNDLPAQYI
jgi:transposase InsO family protein